MLTTVQLQAAKAVPIVNVLALRDEQPVREIGNELVYRSPKTNERTPSLFVNPSRNVFTDYSGQQSGDVIRLVQHLDGCTFPEAVRYLLDLANRPAPDSFSFSGPSPAPSQFVPAKMMVTAIRPLNHASLLRYAESRRISSSLAVRYCHQVHYTNKGREFFALGFANDAGGWELRSEHFKGGTAPKGISTFEVPGSDRICLFEGFFDFLSALAYYGYQRPRFTTVVLNSTANLSQALTALRTAPRINCFLDADAAGRSALERLQTLEKLPVVDCSAVYAGRKDFNDLLSA